MSTSGRRTPLGRDLVAGSLFGFVVLGVPDGMLGVAWPSIRHHFGLPLASLGVLLLGVLAGYLAVTSTTGLLLRRLGTAGVLMVSAGVGGAGAGLFVAAQWSGELVMAVVLLGAAGGGLDAALNTVVSLGGRSRFMNVLHGAYGLGAAMGPLAVTVALAAGSSWRGAYGALLVLELALLTVWIALRHILPHALPSVSQDRGRAHRGRDRGAPHLTSRVAGLVRPGHRGALLLSLTVFFLYTGLEVAVASWSASFLRGPGGLSAPAAALAVFVYWMSLTAGRVGTAVVGRRVSVASAARAGALGSVGGAALMWANLSPAGAVVALVVMGLSLGPVFPALVTLTPLRLGEAAAFHAVGWELAAAAVGGSGLSAIVGVVLELEGLTSFGAALVCLALCLACANFGLEKVVPAGRPGPGDPSRSL